MAPLESGCSLPLGLVSRTVVLHPAFASLPGPAQLPSLAVHYPAFLYYYNRELGTRQNLQCASYREYIIIHSSFPLSLCLSLHLSPSPSPLPLSLSLSLCLSRPSSLTIPLSPPSLPLSFPLSPSLFLPRISLTLLSPSLRVLPVVLVVVPFGALAKADGVVRDANNCSCW